MLAQPVGRPEDHNWNFSGSSKVTAIVFEHFDGDVLYIVLGEALVGAFKQKKAMNVPNVVFREISLTRR